MSEDRKYWSGEFITKLEPNQIFVFGSNPKGSHGWGAAKSAMNFGAIKGQGRGIQGQAYGLITKNLKWDVGYYEESTGITYDKGDRRSVSPEQISDNIVELYEYAKQNPDKEFLIAYSYDRYPDGNPKPSLNGYTPLEMINMFYDNKEIPKNIVFHDTYKKFLEMKEEGMTPQGILKRDKMERTKNAYTQAKEQGTVTTATIKNGQVEVKNAYEAAMNSSKKKFTFFFTQYDVFSQWHPSIFEYKDVKFTSAEQFMMYSKAKLFKDETVAKKIENLNNLKVTKAFLSGELKQADLLSNQDPSEYLDDPLLKSVIFENNYKKIKTMGDLWSAVQNRTKTYGKEVCKHDGIAWDEELWKQKREGIVLAGSRLKYNQNPAMKAKLLSTKGTILVEASPYDKIWGVGLRASNKQIYYPENWKGLNLLGKALTNLRYELTLKMTQEKKQKQETNNKPQSRNRNRM